MTIQIRRLSNGLGAEISGVDISKPIDDATFREIEQAWRDHLVLLFRNQALTHEQHIAFSGRFGPLDDHSSIPKFRDPQHHHILPVTNQEIAGRKQPVGRQWHSDLSTTTRPARASLLRSEVIPPVGGDTMFTNMYLAYDTLSDKMKEIVDCLDAIHDMTVAKHSKGRDPADLAEVRKRNPPIAHPMVRVHPETGRKALYVSEMTTTGIVGLTDEEAEPILEFLYGHCVRPEFVYRHKWQVHDVLAWDNRCTMHLALSDYDIDIPRKLYRTTLLGEPSGYIVGSEKAAA
ncbi:MAG: TauD/TfdA family dioxygenase [Usitatibacter sp.]